MPRKKKDGEPEPTVEPKRVTPLEIQQVEFRVGMRGYDQGEVDVFLDRLTEEVARLYAENKRLREELDFVRTRPLDTGTAAEAEAIIRAARDEAARVLSEARAEGGSTAPGTTLSTADLGRFLGRERAFLQNLANLIQAHAEGVKDEVRRHREARPAETQMPARVAEPPTAAPPVGAPISTVDEPTRAWSGPPVEEDRPAASAPGSAVIQIPEAGASAATEVRASGAEGPDPAGPEPDPSDWRSYFAGDPEHLRREQEGAGEEPRPAAVGTVPPPAPPSPPPPEEDPTDPGEDRSIRELFWGET